MKRVELLIITVLAIIVAATLSVEVGSEGYDCENETSGNTIGIVGTLPDKAGQSVHLRICFDDENFVGQPDLCCTTTVEVDDNGNFFLESETPDPVYVTDIMNPTYGTWQVRFEVDTQVVQDPIKLQDSWSTLHARHVVDDIWTDKGMVLVLNNELTNPPSVRIAATELGASRVDLYEEWVPSGKPHATLFVENNIRGLNLTDINDEDRITLRVDGTQAEVNLGEYSGGKPKGDTLAGAFIKGSPGWGGEAHVIWADDDTHNSVDMYANPFSAYLTVRSADVPGDSTTLRPPGIWFPDYSSQTTAARSSGVAQAFHENIGDSLTCYASCVILLDTIDCPSDGYVLALMSCEVGVYHSQGTQSEIVIGVANVPSLENDQFKNWRIASDAPSGNYRNVVSAQKAFPVSQGSHSFSIMGYRTSSSPRFGIDDKTLTLVFIPEAYGTVETKGMPEGEGRNEWEIGSAIDQSSARAIETSVPGVPSPLERIDQLESELAELREHIALLASKRQETAVGDSGSVKTK